MKYLPHSRCLLHLLVLSSSLFLAGCNGDNESSFPPNSLAAYIEETSLQVQLDSLIACAASGQNGILTDGGNQPVSIIYLPLNELSDVRYFETSGLPAVPTDYSLYREQSLEQAPILNGFLRKFTRAAPSESVYGLVSFIRNDKLFLSNPIHLKETIQPTQYTQNISVDLSESLMPAFTWESITNADDVIYFQVVSDDSGNLISGTYTLVPMFQFYKLDNVVLNINEVVPVPVLQSQAHYTFTVLGVSLDNWVNVHADIAFTAE